MKTIVITGANGGIGQFACRHFTSLGYTVIGLDLHFDDAECDYDRMVVDLTDEASVEKTIHAIIAKYHRIDCLYNIAGGSGRRYGDGPIDACTLEGFHKTIELNVTTQFLINKHTVRQMIRQNHGCIINTASVLGMRGGGEKFATHTYALCKGGIIALSKAMASQYAKNNIRVNVIAPGLIETPMSKRAQSDESILSYMDDKQPIYANRHTLGQPKSVVKAAEFLASDDADFVTGIVVPVDGGWTAI